MSFAFKKKKAKKAKSLSRSWSSEILLPFYPREEQPMKLIG